MSSRNTYLSKEERQSALSLYRSLLAGREMVKEGERRVEVLLDKIKAMIEAEPHCKIQYVQVVDEDTMTNMAEITPKAVMAMAVFVGRARLIDNMRLWPD
jgi:pantoate--beta-alanine ligase